MNKKPGTRSAATAQPDQTPPAPLWGRAAPASPPGRRVVELAELLSWLTAQLQVFPGCGNVRVQAVTRLERVDADGCNWAVTVVLDAAGTPPRLYALPCATTVARARKLFSLPPL